MSHYYAERGIDSSPDLVARHPVRTGSPKATVAVPGTSAGEGTVDMDETLEDRKYIQGI